MYTGPTRPLCAHIAQGKDLVHIIVDAKRPPLARVTKPCDGERWKGGFCIYYYAAAVATYLPTYLPGWYTSRLHTSIANHADWAEPL